MVALRETKDQNKTNKSSPSFSFPFHSSIQALFTSVTVGSIDIYPSLAGEKNDLAFRPLPTNRRQVHYRNLRGFLFQLHTLSNKGGSGAQSDAPEEIKPYFKPLIHLLQLHSDPRSFIFRLSCFESVNFAEVSRLFEDEKSTPC